MLEDGEWHANVKDEDGERREKSTFVKFTAIFPFSYDNELNQLSN
jgi:hypothetical protein